MRLCFASARFVNIPEKFGSSDMPTALLACTSISKFRANACMGRLGRLQAVRTAEHLVAPAERRNSFASYCARHPHRRNMRNKKPYAVLGFKNGGILRAKPLLTCASIQGESGWQVHPAHTQSTKRTADRCTMMYGVC